MKVVILGCGRVGSRLAMLMEQDGHEVSIIDSRPDAFSRLSDNFAGQTILGTGIDVDVLKSAGIEEADVFAAVTDFDNTNIMACEVAKEIFHVKKALARIYDPGREELYHELGLETVCPTTLVATTVHRILSSDGSGAPERATATSGQGVFNAPVSQPSGTVTARVAQPAQPVLNGQSPVEAAPDHMALPIDGQTQPQQHPEQSKDPNSHRGLRNLFRTQS